jgi:phosphoenolpyruvate phosphomutase
MKKPVVYVGMCADIMHEGHINILLEASKLGELIVGLLTDSAIMSYKNRLFMNYSSRYKIVSMIKGVSKVIPQQTLDYTENLLSIKPDFVVHGDDWQTGIQQDIRKKVEELLITWGGRLIDLPYTSGVSSTMIKDEIYCLNKLTNIKTKMLKNSRICKYKLRILEAHNALSAYIVENTSVKDKDNEIKRFDGIWFSSLTDSAARGKEDKEIVDLTSKYLTLSEMINTISKPIIVDADSGGTIANLEQWVKNLENIGVAGICIEDKVGNKFNSLYGTSVTQYQDDIVNFSKKITSAVKIRKSSDFLIIARIESLILGKTVEEAIERAIAYAESGADMILIHSISKDAIDIAKFSKIYSTTRLDIPLIVVPTTYNQVLESDLFNLGIDIVIYANHLLRSSYLAMQKTAESILLNSRSFEAEKLCLSTHQLLKLFKSDGDGSIV